MVTDIHTFKARNDLTLEILFMRVEHYIPYL
jgi:hypothetical protein